jgi:hypothetical protein
MFWKASKPPQTRMDTGFQPFLHLSMPHGFLTLLASKNRASFPENNTLDLAYLPRI